MDRRVVDGVISTEYSEGVEYFYDYTFGNTTVLHQEWACCPYKRCGNRKMLDRHTMTVHLYRSGFIPKYKHCYLHREIVARVRSEQDRNSDRMIYMVMDATDPEFNWDIKNNPKISSSDFYRVLRDANKPQWSRCKIYTDYQLC